VGFITPVFELISRFFVDGVYKLSHGVAKTLLISLIPRLLWTFEEDAEFFKDIEDARYKKLNSENGWIVKGKGEDVIMAASDTISKERDEELHNMLPTYIDGSVFLPQFISNFAILFTYGLACPLLAVPVIFALISSLIIHQLQLSRLITNLSEILPSMEPVVNGFKMPNRLTVLESDCEKASIRTFYGSRWLLGQISALFLSFFLFDMAGDKVRYIYKTSF